MDPQSRGHTDLTVLGAGPAGLALAAVATMGGLSVRLIDSNLERPWHCTYCTWLRELHEQHWLSSLLKLGESPFDLRWERCVVLLSSGATVELNEGYGRVNSRVVREALLRACEENGAQLVSDHAVHLDHFTDRSEVLCASGHIYASRLVVDCTGHYTNFLEREDNGVRRRWQSFVGEMLCCAEPHGYALDTAVIFDWRQPPGDIGEQGSVPPSFAYILPVDGHRVFVEETVLVADTKVSLDVLEARLRQRKVLLGLSAATVEADGSEKYSFPMGGALPLGNQRLLGLGAAARMVHPATGYCFAYTLAMVPSLVQQLQQGLQACSPPATISTACWQSLWPADSRRLHIIYSMGSDVLVTLDRHSFGDFFHAFFQIPRPMWVSFMTRTNNTRQLVWAMALMFVAGPLQIKARLVTTAITCGGLPLVSAVFGGLWNPLDYASDSTLRVCVGVLCLITLSSVFVARLLFPEMMGILQT